MQEVWLHQADVFWWWLRHLSWRTLHRRWTIFNCQVHLKSSANYQNYKPFAYFFVFKNTICPFENCVYFNLFVFDELLNEKKSRLFLTMGGIYDSKGNSKKFYGGFDLLLDIEMESWFNGSEVKFKSRYPGFVQILAMFIVL